ncbi:MAG: hypothetical protein IPN90_10075 [Elusimicrobia bacterium]|nr:hypothetical protein [Elusimicrobiota bacterium]
MKPIISLNIQGPVFLSFHLIICFIAFVGCGEKESDALKNVTKDLVVEVVPASGYRYPDVVKRSTINRGDKISFHIKREVFPRWETDYDLYVNSMGPGLSFGQFESGPYVGAQIVLAEFQSDGPCKGVGCDGLFARFILQGKI